MGTSAAQLSPRSPQWDLVRRSYVDPSVPPPVTVARIVSALDQGFVQGLSERPVAQALESLLSLAGEIKAAAESPPRLTAVARELRTRVKQAVVAGKTASRFGELALSAASKTALAGHGERVARRFLACYVAEVFSYLVSRDIGRYVGQGRFQGLSDVPLYVRAVETYVQQTLDEADLADPAPDAALADLQGYLRDAVAACLDLLSAEGEASAD